MWIERQRINRQKPQYQLSSRLWIALIFRYMINLKQFITDIFIFQIHYTALIDCYLLISLYSVFKLLIVVVYIKGAQIKFKFLSY